MGYSIDGLVQANGQRHLVHGEGVLGLVLLHAVHQEPAQAGHARHVPGEFLADLFPGNPVGRTVAFGIYPALEIDPGTLPRVHASLDRSGQFAVAQRY